MRFVSMFLSLLVMCSLVSAQKKYLVSPNDEVIPLRRGESAAQAIAKRTGIGSPSSASSVCGTRFTFGYPEDLFPANVNFGAFHKDVMAEWFQLPATGTIDTIFWESLGSIGALDSTIFMRIHRSRIGPTYGPGANGSNPFAAPCQSWGYYKNTADLDQGVTPFVDDATDTNWVSTIHFAHPGSPATQAVTIGDALWGGVLGVGHVLKPGAFNFEAMLAFDTMKVTKGDLIWISQRVKGPVGHTVDARTEWAAYGFRVTLDNENYPARDWKFYEHDSGPSNCAGQNANSVKRGWVARGGFGDDSLDVAVFNYWYSMTVTSNVPPQVKSTTVLPSTFGTGPWTISSEIEDCNPAAPGTAGVATAVLEWSVDNVGQSPISMVDVGGGTNWEGDIPAQVCGHQVTYRVKATDAQGEIGTGVQTTFNVVCFGSAYILPDTGASCKNNDIAATGTVIPNNAWFLPPTAAANAIATDDGTAGPFDIGGNMPLFGDKYRYVWIGVNGAITLAKNATDTLDVNSNGAFTNGWTFPYTNPNGMRTGRDTSSIVMARMPINFMSLFWNDLIVADTMGNQFGHIKYEAAVGGDTCKFVVQWDSVGAFTTGSTGIPDEEKVRIVLNRCTGTIEYQYENVGILGNDTLVLVGMQGTNSAQYVFLNQFGTPDETNPRNNWCVRFYQGTTIYSLDSWNMLSVGVTPYGGDYSKAANFASAVGPLFAYSGSYVPTDPLSNGPGYWAKFNGPQHVGARGTLLMTLSISVVNGWNMMGGIGCDVATSSIGVTGGTVASSYFGYGGAGYFVATTIEPGFGYWVKMNGAGTLSLNASAAPKQSPATDLTALNRITIIDAAGRQQSLYIGDENSVREPLAYYELPPSAPGFDARYTSGRMVETYPAKLEQKGVYEYPISISEASYPLTIQWNTVKGAGRSLVLTSADGKLGNTVMNGSGAVRITDAGVKNIVLTLNDVQTPTRFALGQNYPNPFNPITRFTIEMPKTAEVTVAIYDILGRQITTLLSGQQAAGYHNLEWDGRDARGLSAPTGIYFIRMAAGEFDQTQKIMLMK